MSALKQIAATADPAIRRYAVAEPGEGRFHELDGHRRLVLEAVYEAYLMHYGEPRAFAGMDPDMRLLAGDALYALGLARLAERGDLAAVAELAELIALCARAHAEDRAGGVEALWEGSAQALAAR